jgi:hypothetical protein
VSYQPYAPLAGLNYGNGLSLAIDYDLDGRISAMETSDGLMLHENTRTPQSPETPPYIIVGIKENDNFLPNKPSIVDPQPLAPGGGNDLINPNPIDSSDILDIIDT